MTLSHNYDSDIALRQFLPFLLLALPTVAASGCGWSDQSDLGIVTGTVTMDGEALSNASVVFAPQNDRPSMGITDSEGNYELFYIRDTKGAVTGSHQVRITMVPEVTSDTAGADIVKEQIPAKYNEQTTLSRNVQPGENVFNFELEST